MILRPRFAVLALLALLGACAGHKDVPIDQSSEAREYIARARGDYTPPGPPSDPWGPYIRESAKKFDVPETWVREVMHVESGGNLYRHGELITSWVGAMGLMQVMPRTYDELRARYDFLGDDAFDPHNNILAGAAYMREMYDVYGSPGFLAAYNAGPKRLDDYLANERPLPDETRRYVAMIGPRIVDSHPAVRSPAEDYAMNDLPTEIPPGLRYGGGYVTRVAARAPTRHATTTRVASLSRRTAHGAPVRLASATGPTVAHRGGFHLVGQAVAEPIPVHRGGSAVGKWTVQPVGTTHAIGGLSRDRAVQTCGKLQKSHKGCSVVSPASSQG